MHKKSRSRFGWGALTPIAFRYIPRYKLRNAFTVLTIIVGVALIIGVNITFDSVMSQFQSTTSKATGNIDIAITSLEDTFDENITPQVKAIDGVLNASPRLSFVVNLEDSNETVTLVGVDSGTDFDFMELNITQKLELVGSPIKLQINSTQAVVAKNLNYSLSKDLQLQVINQWGELPTSDENQTYQFAVVGVYSRGELEGGEKTIYVDLAKAQEIGNCTGKLNSVIVNIADYKLTDQIVDDINSKLGSTYIVNPIKKDLLEAIQETTSGLSFGLQITSTIALCVSIIVVLNSMYMNVGERTREIGVLRSIGSSTRQVFWLFFSQSLILGVIGASLGIVAGLVVTEVFKQLLALFMPNYITHQGLGIVFSSAQLQHIMVGAGAGLLTAIIGGVFPSLSACRVDIIQSLRPSMRKPGKQRTALKLIGIGLPLTIFGVIEYLGLFSYSKADWIILMVSLLAPLIGIIFITAGLLRIASPITQYLLFAFRSNSKVISRNIDRNLLRSTACFTMIGLSLSFLVVIGGAQTGVVRGIEDVVKSYASCDLTVISDKNMSKTFAENLTNLDGRQLISDATPVFAVPKKTVLENNLSDVKTAVTVIAIDPDTYPKVMSMTFSKDTPTNVFEQLNVSRSLILTAPLALSLNVSINDRLQMPIASIVEVPTVIPNPALNGSTPDLSTYGGAIPGNLPNIPSTITVNIPQVKIRYENLTIVGITEGAWLRSASFNGIQLSKTCYISYNTLNETFPAYQDQATMFFAQVNSSKGIQSTRERVIEAYGTDNKLTVVTRDEILKPVTAQIDQIFITLYTPIFFAALNAIIGVLSIMIMNVTTRRREIGILRSQGMSRMQVITSIVGEVLVLGIVGFAISVGLGLIFQSIVVTFMNLAGFIMPLTISTSSIQLALIEALVISVISAAYPAYRASKLGIADSLRR